MTLSSRPSSSAASNLSEGVRAVHQHCGRLWCWGWSLELVHVPWSQPSLLTFAWLSRATHTSVSLLFNSFPELSLPLSITGQAACWMFPWFSFTGKSQIYNELLANCFPLPNPLQQCFTRVGNIVYFDLECECSHHFTERLCLWCLLDPRSNE